MLEIKTFFYQIIVALRIRAALTTLIIMLFILSAPATLLAASRVKDIVHFEGIRENQLLGYGLVVGLNGSGDNLKNSAFTEKGLTDFLAKLGVNTRGTILKTKNVAAVTVTASLPPFSRHGSKIDVVVSTIGDAKSLEGGVLLATPLLGADGSVYAVAQGSVTIGGFTAASASANTTISKGVPTSAYISNGAIVEREVKFELNDMEKINISLRNPDISTARRITESINETVGEDAASALDPGTIQLKIPELYEGDIVGLLATVEQIIVQPDQIAKIVIDEASGTIVMGENVRINTVSIAQGNLIVTIKESPVFSQPSAFSSDNAETISTTVTDIVVSEEPGTQMAMLSQTANLQELVAGLNSLGVRPRDLITILQTIKAAGALQAEIETR